MTVENQKVIAIIPARGGSKGVPRKNLRPIEGKPLIEYSIEHAQQTEQITRIVVSTDDSEIGNLAVRLGAEVVWRPASLSGDSATSESALLHTLDFLLEKESYEPDLVVFLQATSPVREREDLSNAIQLMQEEEADSLFAANVVHGFLWRKQGEQLTSLSYDYRNRWRRQDGPEDLLENGSFYMFKPWVLRTLNNRLGGKISVYKVSALHSVQVDVPEDLPVIRQIIAGKRMRVGKDADAEDLG